MGARVEIELLGEPRPVNLPRREADIAVRPSRFVHQDVVEIDVGVVEFALYAGTDYLAARGRPDFSRRCEGHAVIAMSESFNRIAEVDWLPRVVGRAQIVARSNGRLAMAALALSGVGIACLPRLVGDATPGLSRLETPLPNPERHLWLASHRDARGIVRIKRTLAFLRDGLRRLTARRL